MEGLVEMLPFVRDGAINTKRAVLKNNAFEQGSGFPHAFKRRFVVLLDCKLDCRAMSDMFTRDVFDSTFSFCFIQQNSLK